MKRNEMNPDSAAADAQQDQDLACKDGFVGLARPGQAGNENTGCRTSRLEVSFGFELMAGMSLLTLSYRSLGQSACH